MSQVKLFQRGELGTFGSSTSANAFLERTRLNRQSRVVACNLLNMWHYTNLHYNELCGIMALINYSPLVGHDDREPTLLCGI